MKRIVLLLLTAMPCINAAQANHVITFFLCQLPAIADLESTMRLAQKLEQPGKIDKSTLNRLMDHTGVSGIFVTYAGNLAVSSAEGQITFPLKQQKPSFKLLVTNKITPIMIAHNTISHWEIEQGTPAEMYKIEKILDVDSNAYFWNVTKEELPKNNIISIDTITIIAKPKDIFVPVGISISDDNPQLELPDVYVRNGIPKATNALYILNIKNFFSPITKIYKKDTINYTSQIGND